MNNTINPFTPSFGEIPLHFAGRDRIIAEMEHAFAQNRRVPELTTLISGARGTGKTALMGRMCQAARKNGWIAVKTVAGAGMLEDILQHAIKDSAHIINDDSSQRRLKGIGIGQIVNLEWEFKNTGSENWRIRMEDLLDLLAEHDIGLCIAVDEINVREAELIYLASTYQIFVNDNRKVALLMAGLPYNIEKAKSNERISFVRRAQQRRLARIEDFAVADAIKKTVEDGGRKIEKKALDIAVDAAKGFPFLIQLIGYRMWQENPNADTITANDAEKGTDLAMQELRTYVLESTYRELSDGDLNFLRVMLGDEKDSSLKDIAKRLGKSSAHVGTYKTRLCKAGVIGETDRGRVGFDLPGFKEFLKEKL